MKNLIIILGIFLSFLQLQAFGLEANISKSKILIGTDFAGDKITVFGKKEGKGSIVIIFKSQKISYRVYSKQKVFGIWQNANPRIFKDIYNIYKIQTEENIKINRQDVFRDLEVGILNVNFYNFTGISEALKTLEYKEAFLKQKNKTGSYIEEFGKIETFKNSDLFISELEIPASLKPGSYLLQVLLVENEQVKEFAMFNIFVEQIGLVKKIKNLSLENKTLYALLSIIISIIIAFLSFVITKILYYNRKDS